MTLNYLRVTRPLNLAMIALFMWVLYRFVVFEIYGPSDHLWDVGEYIATSQKIEFGFGEYSFIAPNAKFGGASALAGSWVWILILATILIAAAGNVINDYYDVEADKLNKPHKVIIGEKISAKSALIFFAILATGGVGLGLYCALKASAMQFAMVFPAALILLWAYARYFQKWFLAGNIVVSILAGLIPMLIWMFTCEHVKNYDTLSWDGARLSWLTNGYYLTILGGLALFAFLGTLLRELVKDLADVEGDKSVGSKTLPIILGSKPAKWIISILTVGTLTFLFYAHSFNPNLFQTTYLLVLIGMPLVAGVVIMWAFNERSKYMLASNMIKISMLFVMLLPIVYHYAFQLEY